MAKYELIKTSKDHYTLKYKDQEVSFVSDVGGISKLQEAYEVAERKMIFDLSKEGLTIDSLKVTKKEGSKTYVDESNVLALKESYNNIAIRERLDEICQEKIGKSFTDLALDIGLEEADVEKFNLEFMAALTGSPMPSGK